MKYLKKYENYISDDFYNFIKDLCIKNNINFDNVLDTYILSTPGNPLYWGGTSLKDLISGDTLTINRCISIDKDIVLDPDFPNNINRKNDFGRSWTWFKEGIPIYGRYSGSKENNTRYYVNFNGKVNLDDIDWITTINKNIEYENEGEIKLNKGAEVELECYWLSKDENSPEDEFSLNNFHKKIKINLTVKA